VRKLQQNPPSKLGCLKEIVSKSPPHVIQTQKHMVASNRPLTQDSRSAYPKEQIEVPKDLEMAKSKGGGLKGSTSSKVHTTSPPKIHILDLKKIRPFGLKKLNPESLPKVLMIKKTLPWLLSNTFKKLKVNWIDVKCIQCVAYFKKLGIKAPS
jgi:hypothetical protein